MHVFIYKKFLIFKKICSFFWATEKEFSVLSWHKNVGNDCRDVANNKDGWIARADCVCSKCLRLQGSDVGLKYTLNPQGDNF